MESDPSWQTKFSSGKLGVLILNPLFRYTEGFAVLTRILFLQAVEFESNCVTQFTLMNYLHFEPNYALKFYIDAKFIKPCTGFILSFSPQFYTHPVHLM